MNVHQADTFADFVGVNIHTGFGYSGAGNTDPNNTYRRLDSLRYLRWLGARYVRDTAAYTGAAQAVAVDADVQLAASGIRTVRFASSAATLSNLPLYIEPAAVEGGNEVDLSNPTGWPADVAAFQPTLYAAVKALWPDTLVLSPSIGHYSNYGDAVELDQAYVEGNSCHTYTAPGVNADINTSDTVPTRPADYASWQVFAPGKPVWMTEHGFPHGAASDPAVWIDERGAAAVLSRNLFYFLGTSADNHINTVPFGTLFSGWGGVAKCFLYELFDQFITPTPASNIQHRFGLFTATGQAKPTAHMVRNLIALLADPGEAFTPTDPGLTLQSGGATNVSFMLFQKRSGEYWLAYWSAGSPMQYPYGTTGVTPSTGLVNADGTASVTFALGGTYTHVDTYRPLHGQKPIASARQVSTVTVRRTPDVQLVRFANTAAPENAGALLRGFYDTRI
jgi:hypothetical protein